jgi:type II secretory pathway pseudopilin PulG
MHARVPDRGFSLVEVAIAMLLLMTVATGLVPMMTMSVRAVRDARTQSMAAALAAQKLEQLRALCWAFDDFGVRVSDVMTRLNRDPFGTGGPGLGTSPADALERDAPGFSDFLDRWGRWVGETGPAPPAAVFRRRWSVGPVVGAGPDSLALQVVVEPVAPGRPVRMMTMVTRKGAP